jgi:hypothetical protein
MSRIEPQVNFRIPSDLKARLEEVARKNKRSITAELVNRLESTFQSSAAKSCRPIGFDGGGLQNDNEPQFEESPESEPVRRVAQEMDRQREALLESVAQAITPLLEQIRRDIHLYREQAQQCMVDIAAERRPLVDEQKSAHLAGTASKPRTKSHGTPK